MMMSIGQSDVPEFQAGERVSAGRLSKVAALAARANMSLDAFIDSWGSHGTHYPPGQTWAFELAEELVQWSTTPTLVYRRLIDPEANDGNGAYVTDCDENIRFHVLDLREVGYFGEVGATGAADIIAVKNDLVGIIIDLRCPIGCLCGDDTEASACGE